MPSNDDSKELKIKRDGKLIIDQILDKNSIEVIPALNWDSKAITFKKLFKNGRKCYIAAFE